MNDLLFVLNPRHIPDCIEAIGGLDIPICWLRYMSEARAAVEANEVVEATSYDRYLVLSDDTVPTQGALRLVQDTADEQPDTVVTGYCNLDEGDYSDIVNLTTNQLPPPPAESASYHFMSRTQVEQHHQPTIRTTFAGLALTLIPRSIWLEHPLQVEPSTGGQMDYDLCYRLAQSNVPIVAAVGAYVHHVKERWSHADRNPEKRLLIGQRKPGVRWSNIPAPA